jgi:site-specific recombinase XerD
MNKNAFLAWCVTKRNLKKSSMKHTRIRLSLFYKWLGQKKLSYDSVAAYALYLREKGLKNVSINSHLRVLRLIDIYMRDFHEDLNLFKKTSYMKKQKRIPVIFTQKEISAILEVELPYTKRFKQEGWEIDLNRNLALWVVAATGCRINECLSLRKCDIAIGIEKSCIIIQGRGAEFEVKNDLDHKVPLPQIVIIKLRKHLEKKKPTDLAFTTANAKKISLTSMEDDWKKRLAVAGITNGGHIHDLRASFIMEHLRQGTQLPGISKLVGHKDVKTTMGYMAFDEDDLWKDAKNHPYFIQSESPLEITNKLLDNMKKIKDELLYRGKFIEEGSKEKLRDHFDSIFRLLEDTKMSQLDNKALKS